MIPYFGKTVPVWRINSKRVPEQGFPGDCELSPGQFDAGLKSGLAHAQRGAGIAEKLPVMTGLTLKNQVFNGDQEIRFPLTKPPL